MFAVVDECRTVIAPALVMPDPPVRPTTRLTRYHRFVVVTALVPLRVTSSSCSAPVAPRPDRRHVRIPVPAAASFAEEDTTVQVSATVFTTPAGKPV